MTAAVVTPAVSLNSVAGLTGEDVKNQMSRYLGHWYKVVGVIGDGTTKVIDAATRVVNNVGPFQKAIKLGLFSIMASEIARGGLSSGVSNIKGSLDEIDSFVDATRFEDLDYAVSGEWKKDQADGRHYSIIARMVLLAADIGGATLWLAKTGVVNLGKAADAIGCYKVFGFVNSCTLLNVTRGAAALGFVFLAADAVIRITEGKEVTYSWISLASFVSDAALNVLLVAGAITPPFHVVLGIAAAGTGVWAFLHQQYNPAEAV